MGLEEHLLHMFREDFEFHDAAGPSHHGGQARPGRAAEPCRRSLRRDASEADEGRRAMPAASIWLAEAERELKKIPFFVRGKARRNTEKFAAEKGVAEISVETLYEAKAHYAR
ncbi:MAG: hypothetical protein U5J82_15825 [Desulfobacterales bacterium]|nr:hypothetical protein [Desulfobacterales bacterium]